MVRFVSKNKSVSFGWYDLSQKINQYLFGWYDLSQKINQYLFGWHDLSQKINQFPSVCKAVKLDLVLGLKMSAVASKLEQKTVLAL
jgi:hypothetical protein